MRASGKFTRAFYGLPQLVLAASVWMIALSPIAAEGVDVDPDAIVLRSRVFDIPFRMDGESQVTSVRLYVSSDRGKTWRTAAEQPVPITEFHFEATTDGDYWFTHATDLDTITNPATELSPERKIFIDSSGPAIELDANASLDGRLSATLKLADPHQVASVRVLYATDIVRQWKTVSNASIDDEGNFSVIPDDGWRQMSIHVTATDSLGNASVEAKTFRRPRIAAAPRPRLAEQQTRSNQNRTLIPADEHFPTHAPNQLRVQTVAGPSDPPSYLLGPMANHPAAQPAMPPRTKSPSTFSLQASGSGPIGNEPSPVGSSSNSYGSSFRNPTGPSAPSPARVKRANPTATGTGSNSAGQNPRGPDAGAAGPRQKTWPSNQPMTLPASGVVAKVTPAGIEVLPAPTPEPESKTDTAAATPELLLNPAPQRVPPTTPPATTATSASKSPDDPITESIPAPAPEAAIDAAPTRPRTLNEAMRPIAPNSSSPRPAPRTSGSSPEQIPTPTPSETPQDAGRYRAERAEQLSREQQQRYDRARLARSVPFRYSNSNRFSLEYELEAVGSSGVEAVELYGSIDAGRTWKRWGADPDRSSPFDIETKGEGAFSFRIVVLGNNGLASPRPLTGDNPDIAVIVDQQLPQIKITSARYGEGDRTGSLIIRYECSDENLMSRPVTIAFSDSLDGPWTTIAAGLRNDGLYVWPADPKLPPAIYLRIDATDQAGNTGSYLLDQAIATGGLAPRARILGFQSR